MFGKKGTLNDTQDVVLAHDQVVFTLKVNFLAGILAIKHDIASLNSHQVAVFTGAYGDDLAALRFFLGRVGDDDAAFGLFLCGSRLDNHTVCDWFHTSDLFLFW